MIGAVSASSDIETLSQDSTDAISIAEDGILNSDEDECIFYSEGHIDLDDADADTQAVIVAQFLCDTSGNITITDINDYELFRKDIGQVLEDDEYRITYGDIKKIQYLTTPENILYLNFLNSNGIKSGTGSFWVQNDETGFGFDPIDVDANVEFALPAGPIDPSLNEEIISLVSSREVDGFIEILQNDGTPIQENLPVDSLEKYDYGSDKIGYRIRANVFDFTQLQDGDIIKFFFTGIYGAFYAEEFRLVIDDPETSVYLERISPDYPEFYIEKEIWTYKDNPVAALYIPHGEDGKVSFTGYLRVFAPYDQDPIYEEYIGQNYAYSSLVIYLSDINYFDDFEEGDIVEFNFIADSDDEANLYERRTFHINGECITLEDVDSVDTSISLVYNIAAKELVSTLTDDEGQPLCGVNVIVSINGMNSTYSTNDDGQVIVPMGDLAPGTYTVTVSYKGNEMYNPSSASLDVVVKTDVNLSAYYAGSSRELVVTLINSVTGVALKGATVNVDVDGRKYTVKIASSGQGRVALDDLDYGTYTAVLSYKGNAQYNPASATAEVVMKDEVSLTGEFDSSTKELVVALTDYYTGTPLKGATVNVNINGEKYSVKITSTGEGRLSLADLDYGTYTAELSYKGNAKYGPASTSVDIVVKDAVNLSAVYDGISKELVVSLVDAVTGDPLKGANVAVEIAGEKYTVKINSKGEGRISLADLDYGTYAATLSYKGNAVHGPATVDLDVVVKDAVILSAVYDSNTKELVVSLVDAVTGDPLKGANVAVEIAGEKYTVKINSKGEGRISLADLDYGTYAATLSYKGNAVHGPATVDLDVVVKDAVILSAVYNAGNNELVVSLVDAASSAPLKGASVSVSINNVKYTVKITSTGEGKLSLADFPTGKYTAIASYKGNANHAPSNTTVVFTIN